jgi:hypothetical protein
MIAIPDFLVVNHATFALPNLASNGLWQKYSVVVPDAIASLASAHAETPLDPSYQPGAFDVVCGRGKGSYNRQGNKRFRALVATFIPDYQQARTKVDKTAVLSSIVDKVQSFVNPDTGLPAQFVKYGKCIGWVQIGDDLAREKVGHAMREAIMARGTRISPHDVHSPSAQTPNCLLLSHSDSSSATLELQALDRSIHHV